MSRIAFGGVLSLLIAAGAAGACGGGPSRTPTSPSSPTSPPAPTAPTSPVAASGANALQLQSEEHVGQVVRINATLSANGDSLQGTYSITGGCGAGAAGVVVGRRVNLTGVWTGTMAATPAILDLQMATAPDADANYVLSGTVRFSNTQCFVNAVVTRRARGRVMFPDIETPTQRLELIAEVSEDLTGRDSPLIGNVMRPTRQV